MYVMYNYPLAGVARWVTVVFSFWRYAYYGADPNIRSAANLTPLESAVKEYQTHFGQCTIQNRLEWLVKTSSNPNIRSMGLEKLKCTQWKFMKSCTTVGFTVVLQWDLGKVGWFWEINQLWYQKFSNFRRLVLHAQEELEAHLWVCFRSRMIFEKNILQKKIWKSRRRFFTNRC